MTRRRARPAPAPARRIVVTVCPRETGVVSLPVERGRRAEPMDAQTLAQHLAVLVQRRGLGARVELVAACAGGCAGDGPNVSVAIYAMPPPGEAPDHVAIGWRTYVWNLDELDALSSILDQNIGGPDIAPNPPAPGARRQSRRSPR